ncbi:hypothetical protein [Nocardioides sp. GXQ0305]|uniref:hypothetical protein n=1 Tax=Nocardioides sp. GXQ0305 TaxID=3423912 RepID=UPI003D7C6634
MNLHRTATIITVVLLGLAGCTTTAGTQAGSATPLPRGDQPADLDPADFTANSDHRFFPLDPGRRWVYRETDGEGGVLEVVVTVTSETRRVANGVEARVVRDTVTEDGEVIEDTFDWYAQDSSGNVWYLGEDTVELEDGEVVTREGSFEAGVDGALPGVIMPAEPQPGTSYRQEWYAGHAEDNGEVLANGQQAQASAGHYTDVLLTADTTTLEPRVLEYKLYAPGVGLVLTLDASSGSGRESLVSTRTVGDAAAREAGTAPLGTPYA